MPVDPRRPKWARLKGDAKVGLRRGAWYKVIELLPREVVVDAGRKKVRVPRVLIELARRPTPRWSIVRAPTGGRRLPAAWGGRYVVCPSCRERAPLPEHATNELRCPKCNGLFPLEWPGGG